MEFRRFTQKSKIQNQHFLTLTEFAMRTRFGTQVCHHITDMWDPLDRWTHLSPTQRNREGRPLLPSPVKTEKRGGDRRSVSPADRRRLDGGGRVGQLRGCEAQPHAFAAWAEVARGLLAMCAGSSVAAALAVPAFWRRWPAVVARGSWNATR
jgi:hypothetical protein